MQPILIIGGGISGLTLALSLHEAGIPCRVYESAPSYKPLGVGINLQPHGVRELSLLGLLPALYARGVETSEMGFYSRHGQFIFSEPRGRHAGYEWPQFSIHRAHFHDILIEAVHDRLGADAIVMNARCTGVEQDDAGVTAHFVDASNARALPQVAGAAAIGCDGIHSVLRRRLFPHEGPPFYQNINMWRGVSRWTPFLSGSSMVQTGWLNVGKMVIYPLTQRPDPDGKQLINWVAELQSPRHVRQDWTLAGRIEDVLPIYGDWHFDWLDVGAMIRAAQIVLEFPMVDREPLPFWTAGRVTLVGDAAHPMYPRGGNGANQAILDVRALARQLRATADVNAALKAYEAERLKAANSVVLANRTASPDRILEVVHERSGGKPFRHIDDLFSRDELASITDGYKRIAGFDKETLAAKG